jgi:hypothetical protein
VRLDGDARVSTLANRNQERPQNDAMTDEFPLVVADDLARNHLGNRLDDACERLRACGGMRDVNQSRRIPNVSAAEVRHEEKIRRTSYCHKPADP